MLGWLLSKAIEKRVGLLARLITPIVDQMNEEERLTSFVLAQEYRVSSLAPLGIPETIFLKPHLFPRQEVQAIFQSMDRDKSAMDRLYKMEKQNTSHMDEDFRRMIWSTHREMWISHIVWMLVIGTALNSRIAPNVRSIWKTLEGSNTSFEGAVEQLIEKEALAQDFRQAATHNSFKEMGLRQALKVCDFRPTFCGQGL
jgi:hypothetical protein